MASIKDVARVAGVAVSTASRVLTGDGYSSPETRVKVERAAKELNYIPNGIARAMRGQGTRAIAFLVYDILNPFFANLAAGVEEETYRQGFNVLMCSTQPWERSNREQSNMDLLFQRRIDGLITQHKFSVLGYSQKLAQYQIPVVRLVSAQAGFPCDLVRCDTRKASYELVRHLISLGHRRIAALGPQLPSSLGNERIDGYRKALTEADIARRDDMELLDGWRTRDGYNMTNRLLARTKPDALFALGPRIAVGAATAIREQGLRIPDDIALVCIDDFGMGSDLDPFMTVVREPEVEMGRQAAQLLFDRISGQYDGPPREVILDAQLVIRRSCGVRISDDTPGRREHVWEDDNQV
jgi:LacI family transcriptional regulator